MSSQTSQTRCGKRAQRRRVGRVTVYPRGKVWYLYYYETGRRVRRRVGHSLKDAKQLAAQVNAQLATGAPAMLSFEPVTIPELRRRWLDHHEHVLRSSIATIRRYRAATDHLIRFAENANGGPSADALTVSRAGQFARYLRQVKVSPNGHPNTTKQSLRDKGIIFILETCRAMFNFAAKHRHLPPYHENPFAQLELDRIPIEDAKPIDLFTAEQEAAFWAGCDEWQFPIFLTLCLTGLRPGEAVHLLLSDDVDLAKGVIRVRNKPDLGWRTKTRNERGIPIVPELLEVLHHVVRGRQIGPLFLRRRFLAGEEMPALLGYDRRQLAAEIIRRVAARELTRSEGCTRFDEAQISRSVWRDTGAIKETALRVEFMKTTRKIGLPQFTCPKLLRHIFATSLQETNVDPLIRQELMGHAPGRNNGGLGMTAVYTHTRNATRRRQLETAMADRQVTIEATCRWVATR